MKKELLFSLWLIDELKLRRMSFSEIKKRWLNAACNLDRIPITPRTFHRYRQRIAEVFRYYIKCDKSNGYRYYITQDRYEKNAIVENMLYQFSKNN